MRPSDRALIVCDCTNALCNTEDGAWVRRWLHCSGLGMSDSRCLGSKADCSFVFLLQKHRFWQGSVRACAAFWCEAVNQIGSVACLLTPFPKSLVLRRMLRWLDMWPQFWASFASSCLGNTFWLAQLQTSAHPLSNLLSKYIETRGWWQESDGLYLLCVPMPPGFA